MPYKYCEISDTGEVFPCCIDWNNFYSFGNIFEQSFNEIWNGEKAKEFRKQFKSNNFLYCNLDKCLAQKADIGIDEDACSSLPYPEFIRLNYDFTCNAKCIFCRQNFTTKADKRTLEFHSRLKEILPDILPKAKIISVNGVGEALSSPEYREMIKHISSTYPNIKFAIITNGILFNQKILEELNITDKIHNVEISIHAVTKKTYDKLVIGGNFDKVVQNLEFISEMKKQNKIEKFHMNFVINSLNIHEMESFALWAKELGAITIFLDLNCTGSQSPQVYKDISISKDKYKIYNKLVKIMKNPIFQSEGMLISPKYFNLKKVSLWEILSNKFKGASIHKE